MGRVTTRRRAAHLTAAGLTHRPETLVVEEPLEIRLDGNPLTVTMRTPGSDFELAQGFLLTEGVIAGRDDVLTVRYCSGEGDDGLNTYNVLDVTLAPGVPQPEVDVRRNFYTTSSCGICGKASLDAVATISKHCPGDDPTVVAADVLTAMPEQLRSAQKVFASTGGLHGGGIVHRRRSTAGRARGHRHGTTPSTRLSAGRWNISVFRCPAPYFWSAAGRPSS